MVCCMEQGLLLALSVLLRIPNIVGGRELWRSCSPPSPRKQEYLQAEWNTRWEKGTKERGKTPIVFPGRRETLRAHFCIYHGGNILRKEQDWREVINFLCNLGVKMEDLHSHGMKVWGSAEICNEHPVALEKVLSTAGYHPSSAYRHSGAVWPKKYSFWQGFSSAECEYYYSAELN